MTQHLRRGDTKNSRVLFFLRVFVARSLRASESHAAVEKGEQ